MRCVRMVSEAVFSRKPLRDIRGTMVGAIFALGLILVTVVGQVDLIRLNLQLLDRIHKHHWDDILTAAAIVCGGLVFDIFDRRRRHRAEIEAQKLKTLQATMRTVHDIVNNFLNNLLLFEMDLRDSVPSDRLDGLDDLIQETSLKLKALGEVVTVEEQQLAAGAGIAYSRSAR